MVAGKLHKSRDKKVLRKVEDGVQEGGREDKWTNKVNSGRGLIVKKRRRSEKVNLVFFWGAQIGWYGGGGEQSSSGGGKGGYEEISVKD